MAVVLLDTSVIIDVINDKRGRRDFLRRLLKAGSTPACCAVNVTEIYAGMREREEWNTTTFLSTLAYYPITFAAARLSGELKREFRKKGITLSISDTLIAAVAIHHGLSLLTDNIKDFPMTELDLMSMPD